MTRRVKYETNKGNIFFVELDDDDSIDQVIGTPPTGNETETLTLKVSKNNNQVGGRPRYILFARLVGEANDNANGLTLGGRQYKKVPIPTPQAFGAVNIGKLGDTNATKITHRGEEYTAIDKVDENFR